MIKRSLRAHIRAHFDETARGRAESREAHLEQATGLAGIDRKLRRLRGDIKRVHRDIERLGARNRKISAAGMNLGRLDYPARDILMRLDSPHAVRRTRACTKEPWTVRWIEEHVGPSDVLFDVGANVGPYALVASTAGDQRVVVAFEPSAMTFATLCANAVLNDVQDTLVPLQVALGAKTAMTTFELQDLESGSAFHVLAGTQMRYRRSETLWSQPVLAFRLDDLLDHFGLPFPTHLKIDVDGGELAVLQGAERTLADPRVRTALIEVEADLGDEVLETMTRHGLPLKERYQREDKDVTHWYGLFARDSGTPG